VYAGDLAVLLASLAADAPGPAVEERAGTIVAP
jgi:hypothetical protein